MAKYIHQNVWPWGRKDTIVLADGRALCQVSITDDDPFVAHLTDVVVYESARGYGLGNDLLQAAIEQAREMGAVMLAAVVDSHDWTLEWLKRHGFVYGITYDDETAGLTFDLRK